MAGVERTRYLIIGNSAGGIGAAEAIREVDRGGAITIISDEPYPAYSRPLISEYLAGERQPESMLFRSPDFYKKNNIRTILGEKAVELDANRYTARLESGRTLGWDKLLLATGGTPIVPPIPGVKLQGVFTFTTLADARAIDQFLNRYDRKMRAVVIGGGLIGVSVTEALIKRGIRVTIVEMKERILNTIIDEEASALEHKALTDARAEIITGHTVARISSYMPGEATGVSLDDGQMIPGEMIVVAIGVKPRGELAADAGIRTNRGIVVDRNMATSKPDIYACGDVAEAHDFVHGQNRLTPVWPNACAGGRTAGLNMAGVRSEYRGGTAMNSMKYFGANIVSAGMATAPDDSYEVISEKHGDTYRKVVLKDGLIAGMVFSGDIEKSGIIYNLMKDRVNVGSFKKVLVSDDFSLASLPEEIRRARLALPPSALASPPASAKQPEEMLVGE